MHKQQGVPLRVHRSHSNLEKKTNRRSHEEHRTRNNVEIDYSRDLIVPQPHFHFFLLLLSYFYQLPSLSMLEPLLSPPSTPIFRKSVILVDLQLAQAR